MRASVAAAIILLSSVATAADMTSGQKRHLIERLSAEVSERYVEVDKVQAIAAALGGLTTSQALQDAASPEQVAELLSRELRRFDHHFGVQWRVPDAGAPPIAGETWFAKLDRQNSGFKRIEVLDGNVGYVEFWGFDEVTERSAARVAAVMAVIAGTDAVIFDLRRNGGGSGDMVRLISSYLLPGEIHLNSFYWRASESTTEFWTLADVVGEKRPGVPVYVLTSKDTFSAAEEFAYNLKHLGRAEVVGESTKGGANPWQSFDLGDGFRAAIPIAKAINPVTLGNWEHVGVQPDQSVPAERALVVAYRSALTALRRTTDDPNRLGDIDRALSTDEAGADGTMN